MAVKEQTTYHEVDNAQVPATSETLPKIFIGPSSGWTPISIRELWEHRELLYFLVWRDIAVRYKQTVFGAAWAIIQPVFTMVVFSIFFGELAGLPSEGVPYPIFVYTALLPWTYFSNSLTHIGGSLVDHQGIITKVYFPRLVLPIAGIGVGLVDFGFAMLVLLGMMLFYGVVPSLAILAIPLLIVLTSAAALGIGLWLAALNVQYRDIGHVIPFIIQFWLLATPIAYSANIVTGWWRALYGLNPMVGVVEGFRWALLNRPEMPTTDLIMSTITVVVLLISGLYYFQRSEETFADVV
jgi:lipopolysaccharide transport system permease protein